MSPQGLELIKTYGGPAQQLQLADKVPDNQPCGVRQLVSVLVHYHVASTVNVSVSANYRWANAGFQGGFVLNTIVFTSNTDGFYLPTGRILLGPEDHIEVLCPAGAGQVDALIVCVPYFGN